MIEPSGNVRVYLACGVTDIRRGIDGLSAKVEAVIKEAPGSGAIFGFRGRRADRIKIVWWDESGFCLYLNDLNSYCITLLASVEGFGLAFALVKRGDAINELVPPAAVLLRQVCRGKLVQAIVSVVGMAGDETMFSPSGEGMLMDIEVCSCLLFCQHPTIPEAVIA